jgi:diguanylate cyclase (GGDEF)-like protein
MNERRFTESLAKRLTWMFALAGLAVGLVILTSHQLLLRGFARLETHEMERNFHRASSAIEAKAAELHARSTDWAAWNDAYEFLNNGSEKFIASNLSVTAQQDLQIHYGAYIRSDGTYAFECTPDLHDGIGSLDRQMVRRALQIDRLDVKSDVSPVSDILALNGRIMCFSRRPVVDTERNHRSNGWLIWARLLSDADIAQISAITGLALKVKPVDGQVASLSTQVRPISNNRIMVAGPLYGLGGRLIANLEVFDNRAMMSRAKGVAYTCIAVVATLAIFLVAALYFVVQRYGLSRIIKLRNQVRDLPPTRAANSICVGGDDEISHLAFTMKEMLGSIVTKTNEIERVAYFDPLTGLPNRAKCEVDLGLLLAQKDGRFGVLLIDVDDFQTVNETMGHPFGDEFLLALSHRLQSIADENVQIYRAGSDSFILVLQDVNQEDAVVHEARRIIELMSTPITIVERQMDVSVCAGGTIAVAGLHTVADVYRQIDTALHESKSGGPCHQAMFNQGMVERAIERLDLEYALRRAVGRGEFRLHYQPIVSMHSAHVYGAEALVRWDHPQFGLVSPLKFIPMAERTGVIVEIGQWVLEQALRDLKMWTDDHGISSGVSINVSMRQLVQKDYARRLDETIRFAGIDPCRLTIEVTESMAIADMEGAQKVLNEIREVGARVAMDDFGVGYSSLSSLQDLPFDVIKIDQSFVRKVTESDTSHAVVRSIISLCHALGMRVTGEGIETLDHYETLRELECDYGQGYLFARPLVIEDFLSLVSEYDNCSILRAA